jgi:hypothetical protein
MNAVEPPVEAIATGGFQRAGRAVFENQDLPIATPVVLTRPRDRCKVDFETMHSGVGRWLDLAYFNPQTDRAP